MYNSQPARVPAQTVSLNSPVPPTYDFSGYHPLQGVGEPSTNVWNPIYSPRDDYPYTYTGSSPGTGSFSFSSPDLSGTPPDIGGASFTPYNFDSGQDPVFSRRKQHEPITPSVSGGKTRTKDKYRVVYNDRQRLELEKEFQYSRYITMRKKSELSLGLGLSERQVKIWFQNRRAKERKENRRKLQQSQQASTSSPTPPVPGGATDGHVATSPSSNILLDTITEEY